MPIKRKKFDARAKIVNARKILHTIVTTPFIWDHPMLDMVLCSCGSGLRQIRCCDLNQAALPEPASFEILNPMVAEATQLFNDKKTREAEALVLKLLDLAPNHRLAVRILFELRKAEHRHPATENLARRLAALPGNPAQVSAANLALGQWLISQGRHAEAEPAARIALKSNPRDVTAHHLIGVVFTETGQLRQGEHHYRQALALHEREDGMLLGNLAWNLKLQGRLEEAADIYKRALAIRPDNRRAIGGYAQVEAARGDRPHAVKLLDEALTQPPGARPPADRSLRLLRSLLDLTMDQPQAVLARLNDEALLPAELIARGQAYLRLSQTADAIAAFATARQLQRERYGQRYEPTAFTQKSEQYKNFFTSGNLAALPRLAPLPGPVPIFLIGFPGSGTSLLEQLLAKTPGFAAADDAAPIADLLDLPALANDPECLSDFLIGDGEQRLSALRNSFHQNLTATGIVAKQHQFVTLRAAGDAWHLGLIKMLFPEAPIIHLLRHPLDIAATNFARDRKLEANCGISLATIAKYYDLIMSLIRHYRGQLTLRYLPIRYEALINDPTETLRQILQFIGAEAVIPNDSELRANRLVAASRVPSHAVVQEPIHSRGLNIFRSFEAIAPNLFTEARATLAPWIEELGYGA
jgi:Tfp pilus assembly protein PilF